MAGRAGTESPNAPCRRMRIAGLFVAFRSAPALSRWVNDHHGHPRSPVVTQPHPAPDLIDIAAVAQRLGVQVRHVRRLVHERRIPYIQWGHLLRFDPTDIDTWIDRAKQQ